MKIVIKPFFLIISSISAICLFSEATIQGLIICSLTGLLTGMLINKITKVSVLKYNKWTTVFSLLFSVILANESAVYFFSSCFLSSNINIFSLNANYSNMLVITVSIILALFSLPAFYIIFSNVIFYSTEMIRNVKWKHLLKTTFRLSFKSLRNILLMICNIAAAATIGTLLLMWAYSLNIQQIQENVKQSAVTLEKEGTYPKMFSWCHSQLDNFTDSIMLLEAADNTESSLIERTMMAYRGVIDNFNPCDTLIYHYIDNKPFSDTTNYPRYWHGYQIFVKPLLFLTNYNVIRILNCSAQFLLFIITCLLLIKRNLKICLLPYSISYLMLMPVVLSSSLQFSQCYYVFTLGMILILLYGYRNRYLPVFFIFINIGILTAYFDFLTYPLSTFGIPAAVYLLIRKNDDLETKLSHIIKNGLAWCIGFGGMWISKWIISSYLTGFNTFSDALSAFSSRTSKTSSDGIEKYSIIQCGLTNYITFFKTPAAILFVVYIIYIVLKIVHQKNKLTTEQIYRLVFPYILLSVAPAVWFSFATNHSTIHYWFTNKECVISSIALTFGLIELKNNSNFNSSH